MNDVRTCKRCKQTMDLSNFWKKSERKDKYELTCKHCLGENRVAKDARDKKHELERVFQQWKSISCTDPYQAQP